MILFIYFFASFSLNTLGSNPQNHFFSDPLSGSVFASDTLSLTGLVMQVWLS